MGPLPVVGINIDDGTYLAPADIDVAALLALFGIPLP